MISVKNLVKIYNDTEVLKELNLEILPETQCVIRGASGSGKSTFLHILGGLESASSGEIFVNGENILNFSDSKLAMYRNRYIGFVFQFHFLLPSMNCLDNILLPSKIAGLYSRKLLDFVTSLSSILGVKDLLKKYPFQLSGGEQQRINIVRALSLRPKLLLCDEPTGNLDSKNSEIVTSLIQNLAKEYKATLIVVTHDDKVSSFFPSKYIMIDGQISNSF